MDRFYIWEDEERHGPFTGRQVERMLEDGIISFSHECEDAATGERLSLDEMFEVDDPDAPPERQGGETVNGCEEWEEEEVEEQVYDEEEEWEEEDDPDADEEDWEEEEGLPPGTILFHGHPTLLRYAGAMALVILSATFGLWMGPRGIWFFVGGFSVAVLTLIAVLVDRSSRVYTVTPRRVELTWGLFARSSKEVRIEDIRTINVRRSGLAGLLGIGAVEFSSTGDGVDVEFSDIWAAQRVKLLVRDLQDGFE